MKTHRIWALSLAIGFCLTQSAIAADLWVKDADTGCAVWTDEQPQEEEIVTWSGTCKDGRASGRGELVWYRDGALHGHYAGPMMQGRLHGDGALMVRSSDGKGFDRIKGSFRNGLVEGGAVFIGANGDYFEGETSNDKMNGPGFWSDVAGNSYEGPFVDNLPHGAGRSIAADGEEYIGAFEGGERHGAGLLFSPDGSVYVGRFEKGKASGVGQFEAANGLFQGTFKDGKPEASGTFAATDGTTYQGAFRNGKLTGKVLVTASDGSKTFAEWKDGEKVK